MLLGVCEYTGQSSNVLTPSSPLYFLQSALQDYVICISIGRAPTATAHESNYFVLRCFLICPYIATLGIKIGNKICWGVTASNKIIRRCGSKGGTSSMIPDPSSGLATQNKMRNM